MSEEGERMGGDWKSLAIRHRFLYSMRSEDELAPLAISASTGPRTPARAWSTSLKAFARFVASAAIVAVTATSAGMALAQPSSPQRGPDLHALLHIRPEQEAAWQAYQRGVTPPAGIIETLRSSAQRAVSMNTPQRLDIETQDLSLQQTIITHQINATRQFYMQLSPDQQRTFDQVTTPRPNGPPQNR